MDAVVPFHRKDSDTLKICVDGIKTYLDVKRVLVVCSQESRTFVRSVGADFVDEDAVVPGLSAGSYSQKEWGWYFQQILKLGMSECVNTDHYVVVDSDTVFLRNVELFSDCGVPLYATGTEYHEPYFRGFRSLLGFEADREFSFVCHHMVFKNSYVREMTSRFTGVEPWHLQIANLMVTASATTGSLKFSEYETYGHFLKAYHADELAIRPLRWANINVRPSPVLLRRLARKYHYCSFHSHYRSGARHLLDRPTIRRLKLAAKLAVTQDLDVGTLR